jgi:SnoaL-like domain
MALADDATPTNDDLVRSVRELTARVQKLEDTLEIQRLQSTYIHYLFKQRFERIVDECFAQRLPDVSVEFSDSGVYRGLESVRALYKSFEVTRTIPGFFILHMAANPVIEIAVDGMSARSHWLSPGAAGTNSSASWIWGTFYVDYVKEDGRWRIAHSNLVPVFRNRYETSWAQAPDHGTVRGVLARQPDEPPTLYKPYNEAKKQPDMFANHPALPGAAKGTASDGGRG